MNKNNILTLYKSPQTVFTLKDIALLWRESHYANLKSKINYYASKGDLLNIRRGIYVKTDYNEFELANKIFTPSYISLETVLIKAGIIFQTDDTIFCCSYLTREIKAGEHKFSYHRLKDESLFNRQGLIKEKFYSIASPERALLDAIYLYKNFYFDNLSPINWDKIFEIAKIYHSRVLIKRLNSYYQHEHSK